MEAKKTLPGTAYWTSIRHSKHVYRVRVEAFTAENSGAGNQATHWHWHWFASQEGVPIAGGFDRGIKLHVTSEEALQAGEEDAEVVLRLGNSKQSIVVEKNLPAFPLRPGGAPGAKRDPMKW
jgi:hypothetical protein